MRNWKKIVGWVLVSVFLVAIPVVWATVNKDAMTFEGALTILNNITHTGNYTITGTFTQTGDMSTSGSVTIGNELNIKSYTIPASSVTAYTHSFDNGNLVYLDKALAGTPTSCTITLPQITAAMDGTVFILKQLDSGTTAAVVTPYGLGYDGIESTRGTVSGTSDNTTDAVGDAKAWMAYYTSGTSSYWIQLWVNHA